MKALRIIAPVFATLIFAAAGLATPPAGNPAWEKLKSLVGEWEGTEGGKPFHVSYRLVSNGTALMETMEGPDASQMVTLYHPDGASVLMTHYCSMGNQPRMRAKEIDKGMLAFTYVDASNVHSPDEMHMTRLVLTFPDANRLVADWTSRAGGKEDVGHFTYARKK